MDSNRNGHIQTVLFYLCFTFHLIEGLVLLVLGALVVEEVSNIETDNTKPLLEPLLYDFNQAGRMVIDLFILVITTGVLNVVAAVFSIFRKCCQKRCLLGMYAFLVLVSIAIQITFIVLLDRTGKKVEGDLKEKLLAVLKENFIEDTTSNIDPISNAWNHMFMTLDCCGVNPVLSMTNDFDQTPWCTTLGACKRSISQIPKTCCTGVDQTIYFSAPLSCHGNVTSGTYNAQGCYDVIKKKLCFHLWSCKSVLIIAIILLLFECIALIIAIVICCKDEIEDGNVTTSQVDSGTCSGSVAGVMRSSTEMSVLSTADKNTSKDEKRKK